MFYKLRKELKRIPSKTNTRIRCALIILLTIIIFSALKPKRLHKPTCTFSFVVRNRDQFIRDGIKYFDRFSTKCETSNLIVVENNSHDNSYDILRSFAKNRDDILIDTFDERYVKKEGHVDSGGKVCKSTQIDKRVANLAFVRNRVLQHVDAKVDFFIVMDIDITIGWKGFNDTIDIMMNDNVIPAICANGVNNGTFWDVFAFRDDVFQWDSTKGTVWMVDLAFLTAQHNRVSDELESMKLKPVDSCFSGITVYRGDHIRGCKYSGFCGTCEHVYFNQCVRKNKKMLINRDLVVHY